MQTYFSRRSLLMLLASLMLTALLALILRDFVREYVILPLLNMGWVVWIWLLSVPQAIYWGIFLLLAFLIAVRSLSSGTVRIRNPLGRPIQRYNTPSRYGYWQTGLNSLANSSYAHERVERELQNLVMQILADQRRVSVEEMREQLFHGGLDVSAEAQVIQDLFKLEPHAFRSSTPRGLVAWLARFFGRARPDTVSRLDIPGIVVWLEEQTGAQPDQTIVSSSTRSDTQKSQGVS
jgi:hypothetical protein